MSNTNPYSICTWKDEAECTGCTLHSELACRLDMRTFHFSP